MQSEQKNNVLLMGKRSLEHQHTHSTRNIHILQFNIYNNSGDEWLVDDVCVA